MADRRLPLPEVVVPGQRLGRHINHDPRSLLYQVAPVKSGTIVSVSWHRHVAPFDQGDLGSCTIQAQLGLLATDPFWDTLPKELQAALSGPNDQVQTQLAQPRYREETRLDPFDGAWEPDDTGSDGLSSAKVARAHNNISGFMTITSVDAAHNAIKDGPFMSGLLWMSGMDSPTSEGIVHATGSVRGGHEWEFAGYDAQRGLWECWQSWGDWGKGGRFYLSDDDYAKLLAQQGDATTFVPITQPAPTPAPAPTDPIASFPFKEVDAWATTEKPWWPKRNKTAANAYIAWRASLNK
jgi:hypothetical protein